jgi:predicted dehydrogenase
MVKIGVAGLGKMGLSHLAIVNSHPETEVVVCDPSRLVLDVVRRYTGLPAYRDYDAMLEKAGLDAVVVATPSRLHVPMVRKAVERGLHVFCEKPFCLDWRDAAELARIADERGLIGQVGYHYRYAGTFREMKRLVEAGAIGRVTHALAEAYGPVVLRPRGATWRTSRGEGGGCLYDYAAHPVNLINWCFGLPDQVSGTIMTSVFSADTEDEVYATFGYAEGPSVQLSVNWSDESYRKMSTRITLTGTGGRIMADREELQAYLRAPVAALPEYHEGWNVRYTTAVTPAVRFNLRGEEYSAQIDDFVDSVKDGVARTPNDFASAAETDRTLALMLADRAAWRREAAPGAQAARMVRRRAWFGPREA